ncbi:hypothetical protein C8R44DRAFT_857979 [Mycena epipterygia]|nr:hypothetical protein C8R44DRAFT_857979 [Mycena epipterygia]
MQCTPNGAPGASRNHGRSCAWARTWAEGRGSGEEKTEEIKDKTRAHPAHPPDVDIHTTPQTTAEKHARYTHGPPPERDSPFVQTRRRSTTRRPRRNTRGPSTVHPPRGIGLKVKDGRDESEAKSGGEERKREGEERGTDGGGMGRRGGWGREASKERNNLSATSIHGVQRRERRSTTQSDAAHELPAESCVPEIRKTRTKIKEPKTRLPKHDTRKSAPAHESKCVEGTRSLAQKESPKDDAAAPQRRMCKQEGNKKHPNAKKKKIKQKHSPRTLPRMKKSDDEGGEGKVRAGREEVRRRAASEWSGGEGRDGNAGMTDKKKQANEKKETEQKTHL